MGLYALQYWSYFICLFITVVVFFLAIKRPPSQEQKLVLVITVFTFVTMLGYCGAISRPTASQDLLIFVTKLEYIGTCNIFMALSLLFAHLFNVKLPKPAVTGQHIVCLFITFVAAFFDKHSLFFSAYQVAPIHGVNVLVKSYGIFHTIYLVLIALYLAYFIFIALQVVRKGSKHDKKVVTVLFFPCFLLCLSFWAERLYTLQSVSFVPLGLLLSSCAMFFLLTIVHFGDIPDIAKEVVFDSLDDALITIDNSQHLIQYNKKAALLFPFLESVHIGERIVGKDNAFEVVFSPSFNRAEKFPVDYWARGVIFQPIIRPIYDDKSRQQGSILWLKDVTSERNYTKKLERDVSMQTSRILDMQNQMIISFAKLVENRDTVTGKHLERTRSYVLVIGMMLLKNKQYADSIDYQWVDTLSKVAPLHDIGKVSIPDGILNKPGRLTHDEFEMMKKHTVYGAHILETTLKNCVDDEYYHMAMEVARSHHERWDGKGYPDGLAGENIPLSARVMAVADVFDALITIRPYKPAFELEQAFQMIREESGTHFDPVVVDAFFDTKDMVIKISEELKDDDDLDELQTI